MSAEPIRWFVNWTVALTPWTVGAASASWIATASGLAGGTGPLPEAATAIVVPAAITATTPAINASRRRVGAVRRNRFTPSNCGTHRFRSGPG